MWFGIAFVLALVVIYQGLCHIWREKAHERLVDALRADNATLATRVQAGTLAVYDEHIEREEHRENVKAARIREEQETETAMAMSEQRVTRMIELGESVKHGQAKFFGH